MTVLTSVAKAGPYAGAGTTGPFTVPFRFLEDAHLRVIRTSTAGVDSDLVLGTDYTVTGTGGSSGSVTLALALAVGEKLTVVRNVPATQEADYVPGDAFPAESHEEALDKLTMLTQQNSEELTRAIKVPASDPVSLQQLTADLIRLGSSANEIDTVANNIGSVNTVAGVAPDVSTVAGIAPAVSTVAANQAAVSAVAADIVNVNQVATNIADVNNFANVYLGSKATAPATRNNGNPLQQGDLYWDTVSNEMFVWSGVSWDKTFVTGSVARSVVTATAGQTVVPTPTYTPSANTLQVFVNGVKVLVGTDYTETSQSSITFASGLSLNDEVELIAAQAFAIGTTSAQNVSYQPAGSGAVPTDVQAKLRESVSVKDFGAVGDGVTDDTAAIQAAVGVSAASNRAIYFPRGTYLITNTIQLSTQSTLYGEAPPSYQNTTRASTIRTTAATWLGGDLQPMFRCTASGSSQCFIFKDLAFLGHKDDVVFNALYTANPLTGPHGVDVSGVRDGVDFVGCAFRRVHTAVIQMNQTTSNYLDKVTLSLTKFFLCYRCVDLPFNTTAGLSLDNCMLYDCVDWVNANDSRVFSNATSYNNSAFSLADCGIKGGRIHAIGNWFEAGNRFFQPSQGVIAESNYLGVAWDAISPGANKYVVAPRDGCTYVRIINNGIGSTNRICAPITETQAAGMTFEFIGNSGSSGSFSGNNTAITSSSAQTLGLYVKQGMNYIGYNNSPDVFNVITQPNAPDFNNPTLLGAITVATPMHNITRVRQQNFYLNDRKLNFNIAVTTVAFPTVASDNSNYVKIRMLGDRNGSGGGAGFEATYEFWKVTADVWRVIATGTNPTSWTVTLSNGGNNGVDVFVEQNHTGSASRDKLFFVESSPNITITLNPNP